MKQDRGTLWAIGLAALGLLLLTRRAGAVSFRRPGAVIAALAELDAWEGLTENDPGAHDLLGAYWDGLGQEQPHSVPWSAAFISYVVEKGDPGALSGSAAHIEYARAAYRAIGTPGRYWAHKPRGTRVEPGDILVKSRGAALTWADVAGPTGHHKTHGDLVTSVAGDTATAVGGNLDNTVKFTTYPLRNGAVDNSTPKGSAVFAVLKRHV